MAATQAQRAALYTNLVDLMGQEAADSLMDELPPGGWYQLATKDDLAGTELRLQAAFTAAMAQINAKFAENHVKFAETNARITETNARITESNAELRAAMQAGFAELGAAVAIGLADAAKERAAIVRVQARQLYVIISTIAAATISIWIALLTGAAGA